MKVSESYENSKRINQNNGLDLACSWMDELRGRWVINIKQFWWWSLESCGMLCCVFGQVDPLKHWTLQAHFRNNITLWCQELYS